MTLLLIQDVVEVVEAPQVVEIPANVEDQLPGLETRVSFSGEFWWGWTSGLIMADFNFDKT